MSVTPTHAGAVVFRQSDEATFFLVISSSNGLHWVLPKGHVDPGETPKQAALRELAEEAGVIGEIVGSLGLQRFEVEGDPVVVQYFLVRETGSTAPTEKRKIRWEKGEEALKILDFENTRTALSKGRGALADRNPGKGVQREAE